MPSGEVPLGKDLLATGILRLVLTLSTIFFSGYDCLNNFEYFF